jgi:hypothetical protein
MIVIGLVLLGEVISRSLLDSQGWIRFLSTLVHGKVSKFSCEQIDFDVEMANFVAIRNRTSTISKARASSMSFNKESCGCKKCSRKKEVAGSGRNLHHGGGNILRND